MNVETIIHDQSYHFDGIDVNQQGEYNIIIDSSDEDDVYDDGFDYSNIEPFQSDSHTG